MPGAARDNPFQLSSESRLELAPPAIGVATDAPGEFLDLRPVLRREISPNRLRDGGGFRPVHLAGELFLRRHRRGIDPEKSQEVAKQFRRALADIIIKADED